MMTESSKSKSSTDTNLSFWNERWNENETDVCRLNSSELFNTHLLQTLPPSSKQKCHILFPLCGKSPDMKAIIDVGHHAYGIECFQTAVEAFFHENKILYESDNDTCQTYKGVHHHITIFCTNFFTFNNTLPPIDCIWDRGGLVAVNQSERELYRDCLLRMMIPNRTKLYLAAFWCDNPDFVGPPNCLTDDEVANLFGSTCSSELIQISDITDSFSTKHASQHMCKMEERLHRIIRK